MVAILEKRLTMDAEPIVENEKHITNGFIPKLVGKKIVIHLTSGGQPVTGTVERYNPYEILLQTTKGKLLVFKHAIATIEAVDEPKGYKL